MQQLTFICIKFSPVIFGLILQAGLGIFVSWFCQSIFFILSAIYREAK